MKTIFNIIFAPFQKEYVGSVQLKRDYNENTSVDTFTFDLNTPPDVLNALKAHCDANRVENTLNGPHEWTVASVHTMTTASEYEEFIQKTLGYSIKVYLI